MPLILIIFVYSFFALLGVEITNRFAEDSDYDFLFYICSCMWPIAIPLVIIIGSAYLLVKNILNLVEFLIKIFKKTKMFK